MCILHKVVPILLLCLGRLDFSYATYHHNHTDPGSEQLLRYALHKKVPELWTLPSGRPVDITETIGLNNDLLQQQLFMNLQRVHVHERIPERVVHAKGSGAFGYFEVLTDVTQYTKIAMLNKIGKKTPAVVRFSPSIQKAGGSDFERESRGMAVKFYTEEGNWDLVNLNTPVFLIKDPFDFTGLKHALKRNPQTMLNDFTSKFDFALRRPENTETFFWLLSDYGIPRGFRKMNSFSQHAYRLYNDKGQEYYARLNFISNQGLANFTSQEARIGKGIDADYFQRDLYNAIEKGNYPSWTLEMDLLTEDLEKVTFNPFDLNKRWPLDSYKTIPIGRLVLDRNVDNAFAQVEQLAFTPSNLVPGTDGAPDPMFKARTITYPESATHRLGINHRIIDVNMPYRFRTYNRDGPPPVRSNNENSPNYFPNSYHGFLPTVDKDRPKSTPRVLYSTAVDLYGAHNFYNEVLKTEGERQRLADNIAAALASVTSPTKEGIIKLYSKVDHDLGARIIRALPRMEAMLQREARFLGYENPHEEHQREMQSWLDVHHHTPHSHRHHFH